ncbi:DUF1127 domain-containing protein [Rhodobacter maris]|uniref:Uncharacterized protein YjiS n=1 Tax=Rhodobacter maris TaxID=446682 RepID=A0A285TE21_9RHOB|nr:DUF1127 domain-containing protein [Rhodobacter maris]SOC20323.1 uncharacterized protein YjiS [Rhodobacter maris]
MSHLSAPPPVCETPPSRHEARLGPLGTLRLLQRLALWHRRASSRARLALLGAEALCDIGLSEADRRAECGLWFWQGRDR